MAASIPQFGNWDQNNVPMTQCFENVRKKKNEPKPAHPYESLEKTNQVPDRPSSREGGPQKEYGYPSYYEIERPVNAVEPKQPDIQNMDDYDKRSSRNSNGSKSPLYSQFQQKPEKDSVEGNPMVPPKTPPRTRFAAAPPTREPQHASIPKFGDWDANPNMTVIFDDVRNKKQGGQGLPGSATPSHSTPAQSSAMTKVKGKGSKSSFSEWLKKLRNTIFGKSR